MDYWHTHQYLQEEKERECMYGGRKNCWKGYLAWSSTGPVRAHLADHLVHMLIKKKKENKNIKLESNFGPVASMATLEKWGTFQGNL